MKKNLIRAVAFLMVLTTVALSACSQKTSQNDELSSDTGITDNLQETSGESAESETEFKNQIYEQRKDYKDSIPEGLDFGGEEYRILCQISTDRNVDSNINEFFSEELTGEIINDTVYNRNQSVMERLNVNIKENIVPEPQNTVKQCVASGDNICDVAAYYSVGMAEISIDGIFRNWLNIPHLDFEKPWWPASLSKDLIIDDKLFVISGDISMKLLQCIYCIYFDQNIVKDFDLPNMYSLVMNNEWTLDKYMEIASSVTSDVDGNGTMDDKDMYGAVNSGFCDARYYAYDIPVSKKNENGELELSIYSEKFVDVYASLYNFYVKSGNAYLFSNDPNGKSSLEQELVMFSEDRVLFYPHMIVTSEKLREMEGDYGILPYPKYESSQDNYATSAHDNYSAFAVPLFVSNEKLEMIGAVTEALAAESYRKLTPAYLEVAMKDKFLRDENSADMLDIIMSNVEFDPAVVYGACFDNIQFIIRNINYHPETSENITSVIKAKERLYNKMTKKFNEKFAKINSEI